MLIIRLALVWTVMLVCVLLVLRSRRRLAALQRLVDEERAAMAAAGIPRSFTVVVRSPREGQ